MPRLSSPAGLAAAIFASLALSGCVDTRQQGGASPATSSQPPHAGMVMIEGRWVSSAWCQATVPSGGGSGGPGGPGTGLCPGQIRPR